MKEVMELLMTMVADSHMSDSARNSPKGGAFIMYFMATSSPSSAVAWNTFAKPLWPSRRARTAAFGNAA